MTRPPSGLLDRILSSKRAELAGLRGKTQPHPQAARSVELRRTANGPLHLLAEIKRRSPSAGPLSSRLGIAERAKLYERAGAKLISVLTDGPFFGGSYEDLQEVRQASTLPVLCKDFIIDEIQLDAAKAWGADAALLIVRCLDVPDLARLIAAAYARELVPLVEIATSEEAQRALDAGAEVIGVNVRDLDTLVMSPERAAAVLAELPTRVSAIHLSGLSTPETVAAVARSRADGALVGEALMRQDDPEPLLRAMVAAARSPSRDNL